MPYLEMVESGKKLSLSIASFWASILTLLKKWSGSSWIVKDELKKMVTTMSLPPPSLPPTSPPVMVVMCNNNYANFVMGSIVSRLCRWNDFLQKEQLSLIMQSWEPQMRATNVGDKTYSQSQSALGKNQ